MNLKFCMRFYPHDDNQGGFFCSVFEKLSSDDEGGEIMDLGMGMDAWNDTRVRQKPVLDDLELFARWYEQEYKRSCDERGIPENEREKLDMIKDVVEAK